MSKGNARRTAPDMTRHIIYNIGGQALPVLLAVVCIPVLIHHIGTDRFGLLTIAWMVVGYFNLFDFGLGRALTKLTAERIAQQRRDEIAPLLRAALKMMTGLGCIAAILLVLLASQLAAVLHVPAIYHDETVRAFRLLGLSIPAVILTSGLRGVLEAYHRFDITNAIRTPMGMWTFAGPVLVLPFSNHIDWIVAALILGRVVVALCYAWYTVREVGEPLALTAPSPKGLYRELLTFGGWMTISNIISPLMVYMDRFFIAAMIGTAAVAFYTTPYEVVFKLNIISEGLFGVLFPLMTKRFSQGGRAGEELITSGCKLISAGLFPPVLVMIAVAPEFLRLWVGPEFALRSSLVMQLLSLGLFVNGYSKVAFNTLQAGGRPDITARLHMIELPLYIGALVFLTTHFGIVGAAFGWAMRMVLDVVLLFWMNARVLGVDAKVLKRDGGLAMLSVLVTAVPMVMPSPHARWLCASVIAVVVSVVYVLRVLSAQERAFLLQRLRFLPRRRPQG